MTSGITYAQLTESLRRNELVFGVITLQNDIRLIVTERGGRIFGPFLADDTPSLTWINSALAEADSLAAFLHAGEWNVGGERVWIAPEIQYIIQDRTDFWGTHHLPAAIDPGSYTLTDQKGVFHLSQQITLQAYNLADGDKRLDIFRRIQTVNDPLRSLSNYGTVVDGVAFAGYMQIITLTELNDTPIMSESWNLVQLNPGGKLYIPVLPGFEYAAYFGDVAEDARTAQDRCLRINITGQRQYKIGYKAAYLTGRMGYHMPLADGRDCLLIRNFFNNPSAVYAEEPPDSPGCSGHSIHVYNDGGEFGGNGEMECSGQTIGGISGRSTSTDVFTMWVYVGKREKIAPIAHMLLGVIL